MNGSKGEVTGGIIVILAILVIGGLFIWLFSTIDWEAANSYTPPVETSSESKPLTKTRCDYTGWQSTSIIEEEAAAGYRFTGRVGQPFCENSLSFELKNE